MRRAVLVLGIARSGTSALAGALSAMGVEFGTGLKPPDPQNPKGNYEHFELSRANQRILAALGSSWSDHRALPDGWMDHPAVLGERKVIADLVAGEFGDASLFGLKDPRLVPLLGLYVSILHELDVEQVPIVIRRDPAEVVESIGRSGYFKGAFTPEAGRRLVGHYSGMLDASDPVIELEHRDLVRHPGRVLRRTAERLDPRLDVEAGVAFIDPGLHRVRRSAWHRVRHLFESS